MNEILNNFLWAFLPIGVLILLLTVGKQSSAKAAVMTLLLTGVTSLTVFKANGTLLLFEALKGMWNSLSVLYIIFPAILLYEVLAEAGCIDRIDGMMERLSPHGLFKTLAVGWVFSGFLQGVTGFGIPVAICVPILMKAGLRPVTAVAVSLLGQSWGNTFGTLAVAWDVLCDAGGLQGNELRETAFLAAGLLWILNLFSGAMICWIYDRFRGIKEGIPFVILLSALQGGGQLLLSQINTSISAFVPAAVAMALVPLLSRMKRYRKHYQGIAVKDRPEERTAVDGIKNGQKKDGKMDRRETSAALAPYLVLTVVTILFLAVKPINRVLGSWTVGLPFPKTQTALGFVNGAVDCYSPIHPLTDSGTVLLLTTILSFVMLKHMGKIDAGAIPGTVRRAAQKVKASAVAICLLLIISKFMGGTGQTQAIAEGMTLLLGKEYVLFAGFIGLIGTFITGSNMSSNILFSTIQAQTAAELGISGKAFLAAQTAGASVGSVISPGKIILGMTAALPSTGDSADEERKEGAVLKRLLPGTLMVTAAIGLICRLII